MAFSIGVVKEAAGDERRVSMTPEVAGRLTKKGFEVVVEAGAGTRAFSADDEYTAVGATIGDRAAVCGCDLVTCVQPPTAEEVKGLRSGSALIGFLKPLDEPEGVRLLADQGVSAFSVELVPRITRAQSMDALSAMAAIGGYRAVLIAAALLPKFFPLLTTAAGTMRPAKVLVLGAGVAGLQAIATARRLGAVVSAYDVRAVVKEEIQSLGAKFVELELEADASGEGGYAKALDEEKQRRQVEMLIPHVADSDVVVTTALIPGRPAPILILDEAVKQMADGSVIIDLAATNGGNCALTEAGKTVMKHGVTIHGPTNLPSDMPVHASQMYARTLSAFIMEFVKEGRLAIDFEDEIIKGACVSHGGKITDERIASALNVHSN
ncbi:MAG TPA: Re/Si-specific NAD(P)(+) transhydrogenase subunit alpha [Rhodothermia bacterium]